MSQPAAAPSALDDATLLERVGKSGDREAFSELYRRYEQPVFHLACHLTGDRILAEEALQDGMLRVWRSASSFRKEGNPRGWILRIVARTCLKGLRKARSWQAWVPLEKGDEAGTEAVSPPHQDLEREELRQAVRSCFEALGPQERRLLCLYYLGGISQREVGELLGMPQSSVSDRIERVLQRMRAELKRAGLSAALPLLCAEQFGPLLAKGLPRPPDRLGKVLSHCEDLGRIGTLGERPWLPGLGGVLCAAGAAVAATVLTLALLPAADSLAPAPAALPGGRPPPEAGVPLGYTWKFDQAGLPPEWRLLCGHWRREPSGGPDGSGHLLLDDPNMTILGLEAPSPRLPILLSFKYLALDSRREAESLPRGRARNSPAAGPGWSRVEWAAFFHNAGAMATHDIRTWQEERWYVTAESMDCHIQGRRNTLALTRPKAGAQLQFFCRLRHRIDDLVIRSIDPREVPDLSDFHEALARIPPAQRKGMVQLPWLKSMRPPEPVDVTFFEEPPYREGE